MVNCRAMSCAEGTQLYSVDGAAEWAGRYSARTATAECELFAAATWLCIVDAWDIVRGLSCVVSRYCSVSVSWLAAFKLGDAVVLDNTA